MPRRANAVAPEGFAAETNVPLLPVKGGDLKTIWTLTFAVAPESTATL
ncbi:MAG: hypothetical protein WDO18_00130 [Acidobacteriota bacterium]